MDDHYNSIIKLLNSSMTFLENFNEKDLQCENTLECANTTRDIPSIYIIFEYIEQLVVKIMTTINAIFQKISNSNQEFINMTNVYKLKHKPKRLVQVYTFQYNQAFLHSMELKVFSLINKYINIYKGSDKSYVPNQKLSIRDIYSELNIDLVVKNNRDFVNYCTEMFTNQKVEKVLSIVDCVAYECLIKKYKNIKNENEYQIKFIENYILKIKNNINLICNKDCSEKEIVNNIINMKNLLLVLTFGLNFYNLYAYLKVKELENAKNIIKLFYFNNE